MKYSLSIRKRADKFLRSLPKRDYHLVSTAMLSLGDNPYQPGHKKLKSYVSTYRIRAGNYRILYEIESTKLLVTVVDIGDRKNIYD